MYEHSDNVTPLTPPRGSLKLPQLLQEVSLLLGSFPDLSAAFDPDDLPLDFILWRDSQLPYSDTTSWTRFTSRIGDLASPRIRSSTAHTRNTRRKQLADE